MTQRAYREEDDHFVDEVTEAARLAALQTLRNRTSRARARSLSQRQTLARLAEADGSEDVGRFDPQSR